MNLITLSYSVSNSTTTSSFQYLVSCSPSHFYKPFELGLFILLFMSTAIITGASFYSRAWSYRGYYIILTKKAIVGFNVLVVVGSIFTYFLPDTVAVGLKIVGSILGVIGVMVCISDSLYLLRSGRLNQRLLGRWEGE